MTTPDIIFYTGKASPFAQRVEIAFQEAKADVTRYSIDIANKPEWYASRVNPVGQVPALVYGSPKSDPENPSPGSAKIAESLGHTRVYRGPVPRLRPAPERPRRARPRAVLYRRGIDQGLPVLSSRSSSVASHQTPSLRRSPRSRSCSRPLPNSRSGTTSRLRTPRLRRSSAARNCTSAMTSAGLRRGPALRCTRNCSGASALGGCRSILRTSRAVRASRTVLIRSTC
ncbi:hypothetical protein EDB89DRAFT_684429 [Lactarius sanguifluus]|nr:hypothetical protein EDB89DRAFT_684429 [Lactarius sanguifluus]